MIIVKKMKLSKTDIARARKELEDYIWVLVDVRRGLIAAGDDDMYTLRDALLTRRSLPSDIYALGLDMKTGEITFSRHINRHNPVVKAAGGITEEDKARAYERIYYFFEHLPVIERMQARF